uniref:C2H2-type domain-containing protein n=1 Tax=Rhodnius prolixus TaxID=13249 RepID=T1HQ23_RHOPR
MAIYIPPSHNVSSREFLSGILDELDCAGCGKSYKHRSSLAHHLRFECGKAPQFFCPFCPFMSLYRGSLHKHLRRKHAAKASELRLFIKQGKLL